MAASEEENGSNLMVVLSSDVASGRRLVEELLGGEGSHPEYRWSISNKYYTADIGIRLISDHREHIGLLQQTHALLAVYSPADEASLAAVRSLAAHLDAVDFRPEVLLIVQSCDAADGSLIGFCQEEALEHVTLKISDQKKNACDGKEMADNEDEEGKFIELQGIERITEALQATMWPRISKPTAGEPPSKKQDDESVRDEEDSFPPAVMALLDKLLQALDSQTNPISTQEDNNDEEASSFSEAGEAKDPFEQVLSLVTTLRQQGQSLPHHDRQRLAEIITFAFAKSMHGDDDDDDSDDDDDDDDD